MVKQMSVLDVLAKKGNEKIVMVTAYDFTTARIIDETDVDIILVGDSAAVVMAGGENTLSANMDQMIYHTRCVKSANPKAMIIGDMPFMSYQASSEQAVLNAGRFLNEAGAQAVKLEGGRRMLERVKAIASADIPVMGHLGLTPQSVHSLGGHKVQGRSDMAALRMKEDALALQDAGVFSIVLECVPAEVAADITAALDIPTIGIGAGSQCDGQVLVIQDLLGMFKEFRPKFVKNYANLAEVISEAVGTYAKEVREGVFPDVDYSFKK